MDSNKGGKLISLKGTTTLPDGTVKQNNYFNFLDIDLDDYSDVVYTENEINSVRTRMSKLATGASAAIPLLCPGPVKCPFAQNCPFVKVDIQRKKENPSAKLSTPVGKQCLVEVNLLRAWTQAYIEEFSIDQSSFSEFQLVQGLAQTELLLWRIANNMSKLEHAEMVQESVVAVDNQGNPLTKQEISSMFTIQETLINRKNRIIKLMVGDRQEKYKREAALKLRDKSDASTDSANLRDKLSRLLDQHKALEKKTKLAEKSVIDVDSSSEAGEALTPEDFLNFQTEGK